MNFSFTRTLSRLSMMTSVPISIQGGEASTPPRSFRVGPSVFRKFVCAPGCSACCLQGPLTLDFLPEEPEWLGLPSDIERMFSTKSVEVNGVRREIFSLDKPKGMCHFLVPHAGGQGCGIWQNHPLECWAAARLQFQTHGEDAVMLKKGFAREWRWEVRAQCQYPEFEWEQSELEADLSVLRRYSVWAETFQIPTILPELISALTRSYRERSAVTIIFPLREGLERSSRK